MDVHHNNRHHNNRNSDGSGRIYCDVDDCGSRDFDLRFWSGKLYTKCALCDQEIKYSDKLPFQMSRARKGAGLLAVKSGFILFIKDYQFSLQINTLERERETWRSHRLSCLAMWVAGVDSTK
jgi:hypothetical protein